MIFTTQCTCDHYFHCVLSHWPFFMVQKRNGRSGEVSLYYIVLYVCIFTRTLSAVVLSHCWARQLPSLFTSAERSPPFYLSMFDLE